MNNQEDNQDDGQADDGPRMAGSAQVAARLRAIGGVIWPVIGLLVLAYVAIQVFAFVSAIVIAVGITLLLSALLHPGIRLLQRAHLPKWLATLIVLVGALASLGTLITFAVNSLIAGLSDLRRKLINVVNAVQDWLLHGPLNLSHEQINSAVQQVVSWLSSQVQVASAAFTLVAVLAGIALVLFLLIFFLYDGPRMWHFLIRAVPEDTRPRADRAGQAAFESLGSYVQGTIVVAIFDAVAIGLGLFLIGVPLVIPLASLIFLGAFIPYVGATVSGVIAVLVALVSGGLFEAVLVTAIVLGVQFVEGNILQPLIVGKAVNLHPVAVIIAVSAGLTIWGIAGALLAVPVLVVVRALIVTR